MSKKLLIIAGSGPGPRRSRGRRSLLPHPGPVPFASAGSLYASMNLRPGAGQLLKARDILDLFKARASCSRSPSSS